MKANVFIFENLDSFFKNFSNEKIIDKDLDNHKDYNFIFNFRNTSTTSNGFSSILENTEFIIRFYLGGIGCFFNFINILFFLFSFIKNTPSIAHELITYINISSLINTISYLLLFIKEDDSYDKFLCDFQGFIMVFSEISQISILTIICTNLYNILKTQTDEFDLKDRILNIFLGFVFPLIMSALGLFFNIYGISGNWCWIKVEFGENLGIIFYCVIWIFLIINLILIICSNINVRKLTVVNSVALVQINYNISYIKKVSIFPIIILICWIMPTINRFILLEKGFKDPVIEFLHLVFNLSLGLLISLTSFLFLDWLPIFTQIGKIFKYKCCRKSSNLRVSDNQNFLLSSSDFQN